jgi:tetratricopeptide (TPR) repeat protein
VLANLSVLYRALGREAEAQAALSAARVRGATPYVLVVLGDFALKERRYAEALWLYKRAKRLLPSLTEAYLGTARAELARGHDRRARRALERALEIEPDNRLANDLLRALPAGG